MEDQGLWVLRNLWERFQPCRSGGCALVVARPGPFLDTGDCPSLAADSRLDHLVSKRIPTKKGLWTMGGTGRWALQPESSAWA